LNGFQVLERLEHLPAIIFSTAYDEYAIRAFEVNAVDYLLKPFDRQRFAVAVQRAGVGMDIEQLLRLLQQAQPTGSFSDRLLVRSGELEKRLPPQQFMRVHRSAIINVSRLRHLEKAGEGGMIATLAGGEEVKVSRRYAAALRDWVV